MAKCPPGRYKPCRLSEQFTTARPESAYPTLGGDPQAGELLGLRCSGTPVEIATGTTVVVLGGWIDRVLIKTVSHMPCLYGWFDRDQLEKV